MNRHLAYISASRRRQPAFAFIPTYIATSFFFLLSPIGSSTDNVSQSVSVVGPTAQDTSQVRVLEQGKPVEREMHGAESHTYRLDLASEQYVSLVVNQRGIDVVVTVFAPDGEKLVEVDSPNGTQGPEPVSLITDVTGNYSLEVRSLETDTKPGRYEVTLVDLRAATPLDHSRMAAQTAFAAAEQLVGQRTSAELRRAIEKYDESLPHWRAAGDRNGEADTLIGIGVAYRDLGERQKALDYYSQALALRRAAKDPRGEAQALNNIAGVYDSLGEKQKAVENFEQALSLWRAATDHSGEAATLSNMASLYSSIGQQEKALELYNQSLPLRRAVKDRAGEAATLNNMGATYFALAEIKTALDYLNQALAIVKSIGDRRGTAYTLVSIGLAFDSLGEKQRALSHYDEALTLLRTIGDRYGTAAALNNIALLYDSIGEKAKALDYYNQSFSLVQELGDRYGQATVLNGLGKVYVTMGELSKALGSFNNALALRRVINDSAGEAYTLHNIGGVYEIMGEKQKALEHYNQAMKLWRVVGDRRGEANTLTSTGRIYESLGESQKALELYDQGLSLHAAIGNRSGEALTLYEIARFERSRGNLVSARSNIETALVIIESLRTKLASEQLRSSYFASVQQYYELYIDVLMRLDKLHPSEGNIATALQASERARARGLLDLLMESNADIGEGVDPQLIKRERELQQLLNAKAEHQLRLLSGKHNEESALAAARALQSLTTEFQELETKIRARSPRYAALTQPQPLSLKEIQTDVLDADTMLLEYSLGDERSYLWAVTKNTIASYELPKRVEIEDAARILYQQLMTPNRGSGGASKDRSLSLASNEQRIDNAANRLSQLVLGPVASQLAKRRLVIVADGALLYVPFGALTSPANSTKRQQSKPLIVDHEIVYLPSASTLALLRRETSGRQIAVKGVAVLADPVFDSTDERVQGNESNARVGSGHPLGERGIGLALEQSALQSGVTDSALRIPRLPGTRQEADAILGLFQPTKSMQALDFDACRATITNPDLSHYRYLHFATHGLLNSVHPELSGLVLSLVDEHGTPRDGFLRAHELFNLRLPAELVVLSACQTGLGKEVRGEGLVGLTRGFMYAGSPRVVVSLWNVSDAATAELMTRFYRGMVVSKLRPAAALRNAQVALWRQKRWAAPFYWAAFTLQGEWR